MSGKHYGRMENEARNVNSGVNELTEVYSYY